MRFMLSGSSTPLEIQKACLLFGFIFRVRQPCKNGFAGKNNRAIKHDLRCEKQFVLADPFEGGGFLGAFDCV
mgnify:CR=1 FL=1